MKAVKVFGALKVASSQPRDGDIIPPEEECHYHIDDPCTYDVNPQSALGRIFGRADSPKVLVFECVTQLFAGDQIGGHDHRDSYHGDNGKQVSAHLGESQEDDSIQPNLSDHLCLM